MDNCLECGCNMVRDYKCRHDCDMCQDCDLFNCDQCEDSGFITKTEWSDTDTSYEVMKRCECSYE